MWYVIQVKTTREHYILSLCEERVREPSEEFFVMRYVRYLRESDGSWRENEAYI